MNKNNKQDARSAQKPSSVPLYFEEDLEQDLTVDLEKAKTVDFKTVAPDRQPHRDANKGLQNGKKRSSAKAPQGKKAAQQKQKHLSPSRDGLSSSRRESANGMTKVISRVSESVSLENEKRKIKHEENLAKRINKYKEKNKRKRSRFFLKLQRSRFGKALLGFFREEETYYSPKSSKLSRFFRKLSGFLQTCRLARFLKSLRLSLYYCNARNYGILLLTFGLFAVAGYLCATFLSLPYSSGIDTLICAIFLIVFSFPLFLSKNTIAYVVENNLIFKWLFHSVFGARVQNLPFSVQGGKLGFFFGGIFLGALGFFVSPLIVLGILSLVLLCALFLASPEFGLTFTVFSLPFLTYFRHPTVIVCAEIILLFICYIRKLLLNKRTFRLTPCDLFVFVFMLFYLGGSLFSFGGESSYKSALVYFCIFSVYFLASNLPSNMRIVGKLLNALLFSGLVVSLFGLYQQLSGNFVLDFLDSEAYSYISGRIDSTFDNPNVLATFIIMILPFVFVSAREKRSAFPFFSRTFLFVVLAAALVFTWSRGAWLGAIVSLLAFTVLTFRKSPKVIVAIFAFIPNILLFLPRSITSRFASIFSFLDTNVDSSVSYRFTVWKDSLNLFKDNLFGGVGVGTDAFSAAYRAYSSVGAETVEHSHNLYLQIGIELGVFALITFLLILLFTFRNCFSTEFLANETKARPVCAAALCSVLAALTNGLFDYVWYNYRICLLFWLMLGLCSAAHKIGAVEQKQIDYQSSLISNVANIDIQIKK